MFNRCETLPCERIFFCRAFDLTLKLGIPRGELPCRVLLVGGFTSPGALPSAPVTKGPVRTVGRPSLAECNSEFLIFPISTLWDREHMLPSG